MCSVKCTKFLPFNLSIMPRRLPPLANESWRDVSHGYSCQFAWFMICAGSRGALSSSAVELFRSGWGRVRKSYKNGANAFVSFMNTYKFTTLACSCIRLSHSSLGMSACEIFCSRVSMETRLNVFLSDNERERPLLRFQTYNIWSCTNKMYRVTGHKSHARRESFVNEFLIFRKLRCCWREQKSHEQFPARSEFWAKKFRIRAPFTRTLCQLYVYELTKQSRGEFLSQLPEPSNRKKQAKERRNASRLIWFKRIELKLNYVNRLPSSHSHEMWELAELWTNQWNSKSLRFPSIYIVYSL